MAKTHDEIMAEDGFELINRKRRRVAQSNASSAKIQRNNEVSDLVGNKEQAELSMQNAHVMVERYLDEHL